ncbi:MULTISPECIES: (2Fe-2S)-binding protein [unclassified Fusibacter]|uniref:(2Fe-2S)-binding protein n=1 Tax=unclassified Fusibacter TaxID=2624464 RepID=UPI001010FDF2|nr:MULTISPECIES: (2Fe-2S)-binding protein [unclassified Fusibacter]MCK8060385.1 (2Fe-2S)-binding protein [Fusibacter sp. A2]NPE20326.1 (2Fe-2S)-binding protein [Fusibacter sp. A1]RXV63532.1 (2Fe-2S)-binding protein [Fusibacter sp. A1]
MNNISFELNGKMINMGCELTRRLLDVLRIDFGLTGTKEGCQEGECGACLVFIDGQILNSCVVPVGNVIGKSVITIEGYAATEEYQRIERAFLEYGAVQCGYCTPGMVMAVGALLKSGQPLEDKTIKSALSGNLCRCTGYQTIFDAVKSMDLGGGEDV